MTAWRSDCYSQMRKEGRAGTKGGKRGAQGTTFKEACTLRAAL